MEVNPHQLVEGTIITVLRHQGAPRLHLHPRRAALAEQQVERAVREAYAAGFIGKNILGSGFDLEVTVHPRRGRLHLRRGERAAGVAGGQARLPAPQAAVPGGRRPLWRPDRHQQLRDGRHRPGDRAAWRRRPTRAYGTEKSKGTRIYCLSGHVKRPGNYELPLGTPLRTLIEDFGGGVRGMARSSRRSSLAARRPLL